jgi:predicted transport protein
LKGTSVQLEKSLQTLIEQNLDTLLGIRLLASEHSTGKVHGGRIDTLGIDENNCPVIIEYKRALNENVINQGLFYLDRLMDHKADFRWLVMDRVGKERADNIEWNACRLLCIASDFTTYDEHAVKQIPRNIELLRYRRYGSDFLLLELVNANFVQNAKSVDPKGKDISGQSPPDEGKFDHGDDPPNTRIGNAIGRLDEQTRDLFETLRAFLLALGEDVQMKSLKNYIAFTRIRTFAYVHVRSQLRQLVISVNVSPDSASLEPGFIYIGRDKGLRIRIKNAADLERAQPLLVESYKAS